MSSVIRLYFEIVIHHHGLVQSHRDHLLHAVLDHLRREKVLIPLLLDGHLPHVLQQDGRDRLRRVRHVDRPRVPHHLGHVRQGPAVVQVEVRDYDAVHEGRDGALGADEGEVGEAALVVVAHVHAAVQHDVLAPHRQQDAAAAHVLAGPQRGYFDVWHLVLSVHQLNEEFVKVGSS